MATRNLIVGVSHPLAQGDEVVKVEPEKQPLSGRAMLGDDSHAESWRRVLGHLETSTATYWLATASPNGTPHIRPVLAVWVRGGLYFCAGGHTRKARNLGTRTDCAVTVEVEPIDLVVEGRAVKVGDPETLGHDQQHIVPDL
ncbi:MAG: pyridoxamine 5'-phosphate oxidase family protein [Actinomycetota bacterium]